MRRSMMKYFFPLCMVASVNISPLYAAETEGTQMNFHGTLVNEPCTVAPGDESITLDFGTVIDDYLYLNTRTHSQPFTIHLQDCDIDGWPGDGSVTVRFSGVQSSELPGYLAMSNAAMGAVIGMEQEDGSFLPLDQTSVPITLSNGGVGLNFKAFVEGEPTALQNKTIVKGAFSATATFYLEYP